MMLPTSRRARWTAAGAAAAGIVAAVAAAPAGAATPSISITDPGALTAGPVELRGAVSAGSPQTTTVLYVLDRSRSTQNPAGLDCDGTPPAGAPGDDLNGDGGVGDLLDCEIGAVQALNSSLASSASHVLVSLETFASSAVAVDLDAGPGAPLLFTSPSDTGGGSEPRVVAAARTIRRDTTSGSSYDDAVATALATLSQAPAGPRYVMMISDGIGNTDPARGTANALTSSGVRLRSFKVGATGACTGVLAHLAKATGEPCTTVSSPAGLAASLTAAQPLTVSSVQIGVGGRIFPATVDIAGGWRVPLTLGAGTYAVQATATLSDGATVSSSRSVTVTATGSAGAPAPGSVTGAAPTRTRVHVRRPKPTVHVLPSTVAGVVGTRGSGARPIVSAALDSAVVQLQGRRGPGKRWRTLGHATVSAGRYTLDRAPRAKIRQLRVVLLPYKSFAGSKHRVPRPRISDCRITRRGPGFVADCRTTARSGSRATLIRSGSGVTDRAVVRRHRVTVAGPGRASQYVLKVVVNRSTRYRLTL